MIHTTTKLNEDIIYKKRLIILTASVSSCVVFESLISISRVTTTFIIN